MLKNYFIVAIRNLLRNFSYSFVNIFGLTIGLACTLVIGTWVYQEYSYDRHFSEASKIYRIGVNFFNIGNMAIGPEVLKTKLKEYPTVESVGQLNSIGRVSALINDTEIPIDGAFGVNESFFQVFSYNFLQGQRETALSTPYSIVLREDLAEQLFGTTSILGKSLEIKDDPNRYTITGVVANQGLSHMPSRAWVFQKTTTPQENWTSASSYLYVKIDAEDHQTELDRMLEDQMQIVKELYGASQTMEEFVEGGMYKFLPMAITDIHLHSTLKFEPTPTGNALTTRVFAGVAFLILILAGINFINITTARATTRAKEVGIRKSLGTTKAQLMGQFVIESVLICLVAMTLAMGIGEYFLIGFEEITDLELLPSLLQGWQHLAVIYAGALLLGIISGAYPAIYMTRFQAVRVLKGLVGTGEKGNVRNGLVLFQFAISITLLVVALLIFQQIRFMESRDLGFESENVLVISNIDQIPDHHTFLKEELLKKSYVQTASLSERLPASSSLSISRVDTEDEREVWMQVFAGDENMMECMGFQLLQGRNFSAELSTDTSAVLLNQSAVKELGLQDPVGKTIHNGQYRVIGVVTDFNYETLRKQIGPAMLTFNEVGNDNLSIKWSGRSERLIADILEIWSGFGANTDPSYYHLDENFERLVQKERVLSKAVLIFTFLAMFISCLGLYGLSVFTAQRRTKEIGIRRVLGATVTQITALLSKGFAKPIAIAFILAVPCAYLIANSWLSEYAYRIDVKAWPFLLGGIGALLLGILTISSQSIKAALQNPVNSLRSE